MPRPIQRDTTRPLCSVPGCIAPRTMAYRNRRTSAPVWRKVCAWHQTHLPSVPNPQSVPPDPAVVCPVPGCRRQRHARPNGRDRDPYCSRHSYLDDPSPAPPPSLFNPVLARIMDEQAARGWRQPLTREELKALGVWRNPTTGLYDFVASRRLRGRPAAKPAPTPLKAKKSPQRSR